MNQGQGLGPCWVKDPDKLAQFGCPTCSVRGSLPGSLPPGGLPRPVCAGEAACVRGVACSATIVPVASAQDPSRLNPGRQFQAMRKRKAAAEQGESAAPRKKLASWNADEVAEFIGSLPSLARTAPAFRDATTLVIAHRLDTIADSDCIAVFSAGELVECDAPAALLERKGGAYARMWADASGNRANGE